jgi:hypothetical protein
LTVIGLCAAAALFLIDPLERKVREQQSGSG